MLATAALLGGVCRRAVSPSAAAGLGAAAFKAGASRSLSWVKDITVQVTFVNHEGLRLTVPGRIGQSILEVAKMHDIELESGCGGGGADSQKKHSEVWTEDLFGRGPGCQFCHVKIPEPWIKEVDAKQPATEKEHELLDVHWQEEVSGNSRLGCQVRLTRELDGMTVYIPDGPPADCP